MEHTISLSTKIIKVKIGIYSAVLIAWFLVSVLAGFFAIIHTLFITLFLLLIIRRNIKKIQKYDDYSTSEKSPVKIRHIVAEIFFTIMAPTVAGFILIVSTALSLKLPTVSSYVPLQYRFSKTYIELICGRNTDFLPDELPERIKFYHLMYFPGCMQADSQLIFDIITNDKGIAEIKKEAEKLAVAQLDLEQYKLYNDNEQVKAFKQSYFNSEKYYFSPRTGSAGNYDGHGTIYVISSNGDWNHQHTESITINFDTNTVTYGA